MGVEGLFPARGSSGFSRWRPKDFFQDEANRVEILFSQLETKRNIFFY